MSNFNPHDENWENKTPHRWIGWGYDSTICEHCRIDVYHPFTTRTKYCEEYPAELAAWQEAERTRPERLQAALQKVRNVIDSTEWELLRLTYFGRYNGD